MFLIFLSEYQLIIIIIYNIYMFSNFTYLGLNLDTENQLNLLRLLILVYTQPPKDGDVLQQKVREEARSVVMEIWPRP